jgi:recombinational DNA repair ATPase RecF
MKILELEMENVRGIRKKIILTPDGENVVIYGPNGTGKSAIVDAIDFLFTGDISRLSGRGSRGMSLKDHGSHVDAKPKDSVVKAEVQIDRIKAPIILERKMSKPNDLICPEIEDEIFHDTLDVAGKGQHVLSRGEILKYIAAEAGKRAEEIQAILDLSLAEDIRKAFVTIETSAYRTLQNDKSNHEKSISIIKTKLDLEEFSDEGVLKKVNECRTTLKGTGLESLEPGKLQDGISPPALDEKKQVDPEYLKRTLIAIDKLIEEKGQETYIAETGLRKAVKKLKEDEKLRKDLANKRLLEIGISLIDETGACPLCLTPWEKGKLEPFLKERLSKAKEAEETEDNIRTKATLVDTEVSKIQGQISVVTDLSKKLQQKDIEKDLEEWSQKLESWSSDLKKAVEDYPTEHPEESVKEFLQITKWKDYSEKLKKIAGGLEKLTPEQKAWDTLTALKPMLERYFDEKKKHEDSEIFSIKASVASKTYTKTKDRVLEDLYKSVNDDFTTYYKHLHGEDEDSFYAELKSDGAQLDFKVDFYGRGMHHPRALHSEGHQDSMGLCLYLALNKKISEGKVKLVILDDVVMSIDSGHRRNVCKLLNEHFPDYQFVITTHNRTWARQLRTDGVVKSKNMVEFKGWSVDTGPKFTQGLEVWDEIRKKLGENEIGQASHQMREHGEFFYEGVCSSLQAEVRYKGDDRLDFGDFLRGAKKAYREKIKLAKKAASSWNKQEDLNKFTEIESQFTEIVQRTQSEHWAINENVHYSKWGDFQKEDFLPIVEAFQDLEEIFKCPQCQGMLALNLKGMAPLNLKCPCGNVFWNLEMKK